LFTLFSKLWKIGFTKKLLVLEDECTDVYAEKEVFITEQFDKGISALYQEYGKDRDMKEMIEKIIGAGTEPKRPMANEQQAGQGTCPFRNCYLWPKLESTLPP